MVTKTTPQLRRASTSVVNVRKGPSRAYERLAKIADDSLYKVLGKYHTGESGDMGTWWQIEYSTTDNTTDKGWVRGDLVTLYNVDDISPTWQPYTATLRAGSLALPFYDTLAKPNEEIPPIVITNVFDDLRTRDDYTEYGGGHNGIDWAMKEQHPVYAMAAGRVTAVKPEIRKDGKVDPLGNHVIVQSRGFRIAYAHLSRVTVAEGDEVFPFVPNPEENDDSDRRNTPLGIPGETGNATGVHLHAQLKPDYTTEIPEGHKQIDGAVNFQQYLPAGIYHWPDIAALDAEINDASESVRYGLTDAIKQWMDNALRGEPDPNKPRLRVLSDGAVYMIPRVDEEFAYPCRPFPGSAIVGKDNAVWDLPHPFAETLPTPDWWKIEINRSFPVCWVPAKHTREIGNLHQVQVPKASPSRPVNLPRYLQPTGVKVREQEKKDNRDSEGQLVDADNVLVRSGITGWVPITKLACDETTGDYLWYQIPYEGV